jgi:coproporphyrinogen III oxidase-like Fe-S oxidoreductase
LVASETNRLLELMRGRNGYIFNLGHGVPPHAQEWKISKHWLTQCKTSYEQTQRRSRFGAKVQRAGSALHFLSARPAVHRSSHLAGGGGQEFARRRSLERGLSLYFHIPFCESLCWYCGCTTVITTQHEKGALYLQYLDKEMEQMSARINPERKVVQLHWGGGTPTFLSPDEIRWLGRSIRKYFQLRAGHGSGSGD